MEKTSINGTEYRNEYFGIFSKVWGGGLYAFAADGEERLIFELGDPRSPQNLRRDLERPICDRIILTPDAIECHYGPAVATFEAIRS